MKEFDNALEAGYGIELLWDADYVVFKIEGWTDHFAEIVLELFSAYQHLDFTNNSLVQAAKELVI